MGSEIGVVRKDHGGRVRVCLVYPNSYRVGMSSLGFQTVYHLLNCDAGVVCERAFAPEATAESRKSRVESRNGPGRLVSYESETPLNQFDVIAFSVSYELDYVNVARVLRLAKLPAMAAERGEEHPLVIAGGAAVTINPEPLSEIVDAVVMGEVEADLERLLAALKSAARDRTEGLLALHELRQQATEATGAGLTPYPLSGPKSRGVEPPSPRLRGPRETRVGGTAGGGAERQYLRELDAWPTHSRILTREAEFGELFLVEVSRGCGRGCKFCVTPACYWPLRWRSAESIVRSAREGMEHRDAIGLVGAAVSDHPEMDEIARRIVGMGARLSVSSLRADSVSDVLISALARSGAKSITIAPEAGSERLRMLIGKGISDGQILDTLQRASAAGIKQAKLYFMVGLPGEGEEDVAAIPAFVRRCMKTAGLTRVTVAAGAFVPKPMTPYESAEMLPVAELSRRLREVREGLRSERGVQVALESPNWSHIEGALSRGDRRLGAVIAEAEVRGGSLAAWRGAFADLTP